MWGRLERTFVGVVVVLVLLAAGCSATSATSGPTQPQSLFDCADPIDILGEAPEGWRTILDVIAIPNDLILQRGRVDTETNRRFSKFGLVLRADTELNLRIAAASSPNALMGWRNGSADPVTAIEIRGCSGVCATDYQPSCPLGESGTWVVYPGGVWTQEPACVEIEVETSDESATVLLPVGTACT